MTSMPASRRARAMIFAPRSWPSRPGLATTTRILRAMPGSVDDLDRADVRADRGHELLGDLAEAVVVAGVVGDLGEDLAVIVGAEGVGAAGDDGAAGEGLHGCFLWLGLAGRRTS